MCPSILNADHSKLQFEIDRVATDSDFLHLDVMDNIFVPNITFSLDESRSIIEASPIPVDAHLMINYPDSDAVKYAKAGAANVTFHIEASEDPLATISAIKAAGSRASVAIKPGTAFNRVESLLTQIDMLLVMTVEPGFGGQKFMADMMPKLQEARSAIDSMGRDIWLQVDGGIAMETIAVAAAAGADAFVAGSAVYKAESPALALQELRKLATQAASLE